MLHQVCNLVVRAHPTDICIHRLAIRAGAAGIDDVEDGKDEVWLKARKWHAA